MITCEHGVPTSDDCVKCREILNQRGGLTGGYMAQKAEIDALKAENTRLLNIIKGCPACSELERNIRVDKP